MHEIEQLNDLWNDAQSERAPVTNMSGYDESLRKSRVVELENTNANSWIYERLAGAAIQANQQAFFFDLSGIREQVQLIKYSEGDFFEWHLDFGPGASSVRKLSLTVQLSNNETARGVIYNHGKQPA